MVQGAAAYQVQNQDAGWMVQGKVGEMLHFSFSGCLRKNFILFTFFNAQEKA